MKDTIDVAAYLGGLFVAIIMLLFFFMLVLQTTIPALRRHKKEKQLKLLAKQVNEVYDEAVRIRQES